MGSGGSEFIYVVLIKPDHMHQHRFWAEQSNGFSIIDGREAKFFVEVDLIGLNFSQVHSDAHVALAGMVAHLLVEFGGDPTRDRKSTRLNSSHSQISYAVFCLKKKKR